MRHIGTLYLQKGAYAGGPTWLLYAAGEGALYVHGPKKLKKLSRSVFTGDNVVFIYPDWTTALVGRLVFHGTYFRW